MQTKPEVHGLTRRGMFRRVAVPGTMALLVALAFQLAGATLFVDGQLTTSSCSTYNPASRTCSGGSSTAYRTLAGASAVATAGTVVMIRAGTYNEQLRPAVSGTAANPITYQAYNAETVNLSASPAIDLSDRSNIVVDRLRVEDTTWLEARNAHSNVVQNCVFRGTPASGTTGNIRFIQGHYNRILNNVIEDGNDNLLLIDSNYNVVQGNTIREARHSIFGIRCGDYNVLRGNYFSNTQQKIGEVYDCGADTSAVPNSFNSTSHNLIEGNTFADTATYYSTSGDSGIQYSGQHGIIRSNVFYNCNVGLGMQVYDDEALYNVNNRVYQNVFFQNDGAGIGLMANTVSNYFVNNALLANRGCISDCLAVSPGQVVYRRPLGTTVRFVNNDILYQQANQAVMEEEFGSGSTVTQFAAANPGLLAGSLEVDPGFVNAAGYDFHLQPTSPLIDAGAFLTRTRSAGSGISLPVEDVTPFYDGYGISGESGDLIQLQGQTVSVRVVRVDASTRTLTLSGSLTWSAGQGLALAFTGAAPDIGAFEQTGETPPPADTTPPTVNVTAPAAGASLSGAVTVTASAADDVGVVGVQFQLDGANLGTEDTTAPYSVTWDTIASANGSHALRAVARDAAAHSTTSATVTVVVANAGDTTPPTLSSITATAASDSATVAWTTSELADSQVEYGLTTAYGSSTTRNATLVTSHSVAVSGLQASTLYHYRVHSSDAASNASISADQTFTTLAAATPGTWTPPIGIPAPAFGVNETAPAVPSPWTTAVAGFYYVNQTAAGATDDNNPYGTPAKPRQTIPVELPAGAVVELHGTYSVAHTSPRGLHAAGATSAPVFVRGASATARPVITGSWELGGTGLILENLDFDIASGDGVNVVAPANAVSIRDCDISGNLSGGGLGVVSWSSSAASDVVVLRNSIHDNGNVNATYDQDVHGISVGSRVSRLWIVDNEISRNSGDGVQINAGSLSLQPTTHHIYVGRNTSHHNKQTGLWTKQAVDVIFSQNTCYGHRSSDSSEGDGMGGQYAPSWVWFLFNEIYDNERGIRMASDSGLGNGTEHFYIGNVIWDIHDPSPADPADGWGAAAICVWGGVNSYIVNNTFWDVDSAIRSPRSNGRVYIYNNLSDAAVGGNSQIVISDATLARNSTLEYTVFRNPTSFRWGSDTAYVLAQLQASLGQGITCDAVADLGLQNPAAGDFRLVAGSPAIDAGVDVDTISAVAVYNRFQSRYGIDIRKDAAGVTRPAGAKFDAGALEFGGTGRPSAPAGLRVVGP